MLLYRLVDKSTDCRLGTIELLADPDALREIERARKDIARGKGIDIDELRRRYLRPR